MEPYMDLAMATEVCGKGHECRRREDIELTLEERYVWRVASALKGLL